MRRCNREDRDQRHLQRHDEERHYEDEPRAAARGNGIHAKGIGGEGRDLDSGSTVEGWGR